MYRIVLSTVLVIVVAGCAGSQPAQPDVDGGTTNPLPNDSGVARDDGGPVDAVDAGLDAGRPHVELDGGPLDAGRLDAGHDGGQTRAGQVLFHEVYAVPPGGAGIDANCDGVAHPDDDEFVEFINTGDTAASLSNHVLMMNSTVVHRFNEDDALNAHSAVVLFGGGVPTFPGVHTWCPREVDAMVINASDTLVGQATNTQLELRDGNGVLVDAFNVDATAAFSSTFAPQGDIGGERVGHNVFAVSIGSVSPGLLADGSTFDGQAPPAGCLQSDECAAAETCHRPACIEFGCAQLPLDDGVVDPAIAQSATDCVALVCDGLGGTRAVAENGEIPDDDADECTHHACVGGIANPADHDCAPAACVESVDHCLENGRYNDDTCDYGCRFPDPVCGADFPLLDPCFRDARYGDGTCDNDCMDDDPDCLHEQNPIPPTDQCADRTTMVLGSVCEEAPTFDLSTRLMTTRFFNARAPGLPCGDYGAQYVRVVMPGNGRLHVAVDASNRVNLSALRADCTTEVDRSCRGSPIGGLLLEGDAGEAFILRASSQYASSDVQFEVVFAPDE